MADILENSRKTDKLPDNCSYCDGIIDTDDYLKCVKCKKRVHVKCLKRGGTPGGLCGDVFFYLNCYKCTNDGKEIFIRQKLPWMMIITIALYNLSITAKGLGHHGFYHWRTHIASFIEKNWDFLFEPRIKRKKKWIGTISGVLSHNNPQLFLPGYEAIQEPGWWKLTYNQTPKFYLKLNEELLRKKSRRNESKRPFDETTSYSSELSNGSSDAKILVVDEEFSRTMPYMGRARRKVKIERNDEEPSTSALSEHSTTTTDPTETFNAIQNHLMDFIDANLSNSEVLNDLPNIPSNYLIPLANTNVYQSNLDEDSTQGFLNSDFEDFDVKPVIQTDDLYQEEISNFSDCSSVDICIPRIVQITNFQNSELNVVKTEFSVTEIKEESASLRSEIEDSEEEETEKDDEFACEKSLFTVNRRRELPWKQPEEEVRLEKSNNEEEKPCNLELEMMNEYEEKEIYRTLKSIISVEHDYKLEIPAWIRRYYRKLAIRNDKRQHLKPIFDIDNSKRNTGFSELQPQILDRYYQLLSKATLKEDCSFHARIAGTVEYELFESPHTSRILHPFIYRHTDCFPPWVKLMCEIKYTVTGTIPSREPVDFCYVRPHHIAAVNGLLQRLFWPGIDMSECLSYPDYSVVALYKKLVVGCAFLVPDVGYNEAYISFMAVRPGWQRSGIATFMLYHLTQTCMGKDITLHVAATNPAIFLYQKFGFKIEEIILDFYDKYLPIESHDSRHAFLLRLSR